MFEGRIIHAFELRGLSVSMKSQRIPDARQEVPPGDVSSGIPHVFAEEVGEGAVVSAIEEGIGGCLVGPAPGPENMVGGASPCAGPVHGIESSGRTERTGFSFEPEGDVRRRR